MRIDKINYYLDIAEAVLERSTCLRRKYGAIVVSHDQIISTGYNGSPRGETNCCDSGICKRNELHIPAGERYELCVAVHAEQNALLSISRQDAIGATIYIVGKNVKEGSYADAHPCVMCRRFIKNMGIKNIVMRVDKIKYLIENKP